MHISQLDTSRVNKVEDIVKLGDKMRVKVTEIDRQGRVNASRKVLLEADKEERTKKKTNRTARKLTRRT